MTKRYFFIYLAMIFSFVSMAQDTTIIQTLTYDSTGRDYMFQFPVENGTTYEKIIMQYSMRCKDGLVSTSGAPNDHGCGEWDYSCNTFLTDSSKTDSIKATHASHLISSFSGTTYEYTTIPTYSYIQYQQQNVEYTSTTSENTANLGSGTEALAHPFNTSGKVSKTQYLWTADELTTAGLTVDDLTGLSLNVTSANGVAQFLRIRVKSTTATALDENNPDTDGFTEVYFLNTTLTAGINNFNFYNAFAWNGTSNLLVEFSFTNSETGTDNIIEGHDSGSQMSLLTNSNDKYLEFAGIGNVDISNSDYSTVNSEVSVVFWAYGNVDALPANTSPFEAVDAQSKRQVHSHLPWENSRAYWDCGYDGSYDRIDKEATESELEGQWNHWAFTKNATTGQMKIYLNGSVWHSGTGKNNLIDVETFKFGSNVKENYPYFGFMDNFSVWDTELDQATIENWMYKDVDDTHPEYNHLINYFALNEGVGNDVVDLSTNSISGIHSGLASRKAHRGKDLFKDFTGSTYRPNLGFVQGEYEQSITEILVLDSTQNNPNLIYDFEIVDTDLMPIDTVFYYEAGESIIFDEAGTEVGTVDNPVEGTIEITELTYYKKYPSVFEIMSFVTPYGLGLNLGMAGKMWQFDVTDLGPILNGSKRMHFTGGIYQEDLDIRFLFIEGTPARDVIDVQQIWRAGSQRNYTDLMNDKYFEPRTVQLNAESSMYKVRAAITGHGQQGEFIPRTHYLNIDGGAKEFEWSVWKECAENPIYPQGGTWVYDRAGWCPGEATDLQEFEITEYTSPGGTVELDYGVATGSGDSRYIINMQLVSYGSPNFELDAELVDIQRPSKRIEFGRVNPVCYHPTVVIRNTGSTTLTSLNITYGVSGGSTETFAWSGSLEFNKMDTVALPMPDAGFWMGNDDHIFTATISDPNGATDSYINNNEQTSEYEMPDMIEGAISFSLNTNSRAYENSYQIKDFNGNVIFSKTGLENNTNYKDTFELAPGCYTMELYDTGNDGLQWWANTAQGNGNLSLRNVDTGNLLKYFEKDFGSILIYSFVIDNYTYVKERGEGEKFEVYPNPTNGQVSVDVDQELVDLFTISITDLAGRTIAVKNQNQMVHSNLKFDLSDQPDGIYLCKIQTSKGTQVKKIILSK